MKDMTRDLANFDWAAVVRTWSDAGVLGRYIARRTADGSHPGLAVSWTNGAGDGILCRGAERICKVAVEPEVRANDGNLGPRIEFRFESRSFSFLTANDAELIQLDNILQHLRHPSPGPASYLSAFEHVLERTDLMNDLIRGNRIYARLAELGQRLNAVPTSRIRAIVDPDKLSVSLVAGERSVYFSQAEDDSFTFTYPGRPVLAEARMYAPGFDSWAEEFFERILTETYVLRKRRILGLVVQRRDDFETDLPQARETPFAPLETSVILPSAL